MSNAKSLSVNSFRTFLIASTSMAMALSLGTLPASAQSDAEDDVSVQEKVVVTGSYIQRDASDSASPLAIVNRQELNDQGVSNPIDFVKFLTINTGSDFNADIFATGGQTGTAQYNLRGLGLASTLVLLNGRRSTLSGADADNNLSFIDVNSLLPHIMIDRIEILKDGASSLYGSDAVAGVVNHITRDRYVGGDVLFEYRQGQGDQETFQVDGLYGWDFGSTNVVLAASYVDQKPLLASERDFATVSSGVGNPASFFPQSASGANIGGPQPDPLCVAGGGFLGGPLCRFDLAPFTDLVSEDERFLSMLTVRHDFANGTELFADFNYSTRDTKRTGAPSFPGLRPISIPLTHPRVIAGDSPFDLANPPGPPGAFGQIRFFGRPLGNGFEPQKSTFEDNYLRASVGLRGDFNDTWSYEGAITYSQDDYTNVTTNDVLFNELQDAINSGAFNPFATALTGVAPNDPAVIASFRSDLIVDVETSLFTMDGVITRDLFEMEGGTAGLAIGAQYRTDDRQVDLNDVANQERFYFLVGGPDSGGDVGAHAVFVETVLPVTDWMEIQAALRYENYDIDSIGDSVDPKIAVLIQPNEMLSLRGSYSTAFRAPQAGQLFETTVAVTAVFDPTAGAALFVPVRTVGNEQLEPEKADTYNIGATLAPNDMWSFSADYWSFEYEDLITVQNASGIVAANLADPTVPGVIRTQNGVLQEVQRSLINAPSLKTDGLDFSVRFNSEIPNTDIDFSVLANATHILTYDLVETVGGPTLDLAGARNYNNSGFAAPDWRANLTIAAQKGGIRGSLTGRHISDFTNDTGANPGESIDSWTVFDGQISWDLAESGLANFDTVRPVISIGATNIGNEEPPFADTSNAFPIATRVHDPRGRTIYVKLGTEF